MLGIIISKIMLSNSYSNAACYNGKNNRLDEFMMYIDYFYWLAIGTRQTVVGFYSNADWILRGFPTSGSLADVCYTTRLKR